MSIFRWTAPLFKLAARRWSQNDFQVMAAWLRPYVAPDGVFADLGGGTGDLGTGVARTLDARVIIVDPTPQMLRRVDAHPLVSVQLAPAEKLPFPAGYFDAVLCCDAFHHLPDQDTTAKEIARVLRPGGGLLILDAEPTGRNRHWAVLERTLGEPAGFRTMASMEKFLGGYGIVGTCTSQRRGYAFVGSVGTASATET